MPVSEKKLRSNPAWIKRHLTDPFVKKSVQEGYRARSVYKLMEIDDKDKIIKPGMSVVDLGAAPGSIPRMIFSLTGCITLLPPLMWGNR